MKPKRNKKSGKIILWIIAIIIFYILTTAAVSTGVAEVSKKSAQQQTFQEPYIAEKIVKTTKYREERVPFGTPRCEQFVYNFSKTFTYSEHAENGKKVGTCTFIVKNEEDIEGIFNFYPQMLKSGNINDGPKIKKKIGPFESARFEWNVTLEFTDTLSCMLQSEDYPTRMKCFYLEPITYQIKQVPYTVEEKKNVTEYRTITRDVTAVVKQNETRNIYTNRYFGYNQFFYFGY